ncbi:Collagen triple helix repeat (20 copies) [Burkholderia pseudomallei]|nr:Collagen triple helix repeat (20 copies) [Burkholderia pseudomallei]
MSDTTEKIVSYKGFDADMKCRGFQYATGEEYTHEGDVEACAAGFHACEYPLDVLRYYSPNTSRFFVVEQSGKLSRHDEDSKVASSKIKIGVELSLPGLIKAAVEYTFSRAKPIDPNSPAYSTADNGAATASGDSGAATASGDRGAATASGYSGAATASGDSGAATASGCSGAATASGYSGAATASGDSGAATASGDRGAATASGYSGAATASGYSGAATASGCSGAATASGYSGAATASGCSGAATASGRHSVAMASGFYGRARGIDGAALFLVYRDEDNDGDDFGRILHARALIVGRGGIKADTWYSLNENGEPVEV